MKHIHLYLFALISVILTSCSHACQKVELQEDTVSLLRNPCMGWGVYDDANLSGSTPFLLYAFAVVFTYIGQYTLYIGNMVEACT